MDDWSFLLESAQASWRAAGEPGRVAAAVSGGADSVALLFMLSCLAPRSGFSLSAVHVDHGLRPESGEDAAFVMRLCEKLGIPCKLEIGESGGHGFSDGSGMCMEGWPERAVRWAEKKKKKK